MAIDQRARLLHASQAERVLGEGCTLRWLVDSRLGARHVMSYQLVVEPGGSFGHSHPGAEEVLYVVEGEGVIAIEGAEQALSAGVAVHVPDGAEHWLENNGCSMLTVVGAMSPLIDPGDIRPAVPRLHLTHSSAASVQESAVRPVAMREESVTPTLMGERSFRLLVNPEVGCLRMSQFTGVIPPGRAPLHAHPYEEAVYVLEGRGRLWIEEEAVGDLRPGSVVFFPIGVRHTLENSATMGDLKVLGAIAPAHSPDAKA
jgi:quercetin dioxygenase-like cupin family protein